MAHARLPRRRAARTLLSAMCAAALVAAAPAPANAQPERLGPPGAAPQVPGFGDVARPRVTRPGPLPHRTGKVAVTGVTGRTATGSASSSAAAAGLNDKVTLRALVIGTNSDDFGVATWKTTLDRVGVAYDVLYSATTPVTTSTLVQTDGVGKYNAILLTSSMQVYASGGSYLNGLDGGEWNILWAYERNFGVRQAALYTSYGSWPEDYCLRSAGDLAVGDTPLNAELKLEVWDSPTNVLGVRTTSTDGRERLALTFSNNQYLLQSDLLVYGMVRWATKGMFLGEQRHHLNVDIDDWFNTADHYYPDGHVEYSPGFQVSAHDMVNLDNRQAALGTAQPQAAGFTFNLALNGADIDPFAGSACSPNGGPTELTATSKCLASHFRWLNHTLNHPELNNTDYAFTYAEINDNRTAASSIGLNTAADVLKTPEYSGLGVYTADPNNDTGTPVDHGLAASNRNLLQAAKDLNVKYLHGNFSFNSHKPAHFNAGVVHPLESSISVVPDWPTNIAYFVTTPAEETHFYNSFYGPNGKFPYWPTDRTYQQILDYEAGVGLHVRSAGGDPLAGVGLQHVASGSINTHTFHIANSYDYGSGRTLVTDWLENVVGKYTSYYSVPLLNVDWSSLGAYTTLRTAHFAQLGAGANPIYDRSTGLVTVTSPLAGTVQSSGVQAATSTTYGSDVTAPVALAAGTAVTLTAAPRL